MKQLHTIQNLYSLIAGQEPKIGFDSPDCEKINKRCLYKWVG